MKKSLIHSRVYLVVVNTAECTNGPFCMLCITVATGFIDNGTCEGLCGQLSQGDCWCDDECMDEGDCCDDYEAVCVDGVFQRPVNIVARFCSETLFLNT